MKNKMNEINERSSSKRDERMSVSVTQKEKIATNRGVK